MPAVLFSVQCSWSEMTDIINTGCIQKKVIELWSALARPLYNLQKSLFRSRKDQAFSFRLLPCLSHLKKD